MNRKRTVIFSLLFALLAISLFSGAHAFAAVTLNAANVTLSADSFVYNGAVQKPTVTVKNASGATLTENTSYTVSYPSGCKYPGTYTVTVTGKGNYSGTVIKSYTISKQPLDASRVTLEWTTAPYNAKVQQPAVTVKNARGGVMTEDSSYTVIYAEESKFPGSYSVTVTACGSCYTGTVAKTYTLTTQPLEADHVTLDWTSKPYNGAVQKPTLTVTDMNGTWVLTEGKHYTVTWPSGSKNPGNYMVTVKGKGNFGGTISKTYSITSTTEPLDASLVTLSKSSFTYNGAVQQPTVTVKNAAGATLVKDTDYALAFSSGCKFPGTYSVTVTGKGNYTGSVKKSFTIAKQPLNASRVTLSWTSKPYNGAIQKPTVTVKNARGGVMTENSSYTSYTVSYAEESKFPGSYSVTVTACGSCYTGTITKTYTLTTQSLEADHVTLDWTSKPYNGAAQKPTLTVTDMNGTWVLTEGKHYTVTWPSGSKNPGNYTVTVKGKGNFSGTVSKTYSITSVSQALDASLVTLSNSTFTYNDTVQQPTVTVKNAAGVTLVMDTDYTLAFSSGCIIPGTYTVTVTGKGNYTGSVEKSFTIAKQPLNASRVTLSWISKPYNGAIQKPTVTVKNANGDIMTENSSYTVSYAEESKFPGSYSVTVTACGPYYNGTATKAYTLTTQSLEADHVTLNWTSQPYNGAVQKPTLTVTDMSGTWVLTEGKHYTVTWPSGSKDPDVYTVTIKGKGNFSGTVMKDYSITAPPELTAENVAITGTCFRYDGTVKSPEIAVSVGGVDLVKDEDYTVSYSGDCIENGTYTVTVAGINRYAGEVTASFTISESGHTPEAIPAVAATCTVDGATEGSKCAVCGTILTAPEVIPALGHQIAAVEAKTATCTENGNNDYYRCTRCGAAFTDAAGENETTVEAQTIPSTGHSYLWKAIPATCTEKAQVQKLCDNCNVIFDIVYDDSTAAIGHSGVVHVPASCTEGGYNETNCTNSFVVKYYYDEALTEEAFDEDLTCGFMEKAYIESEPDLGGHLLSDNASAWTTVTPAACLTGGTESQACTRCGEVVIRETEPLGHDITNALPITNPAPTCNNTGLQYYECNRCGQRVQETVLPKAHDFDGFPTVSIQPQCAEKGYEITECQNGCMLALSELQAGDIIKLNAESITSLNGVTISTDSDIEALFAVIDSISADNQYTVNFTPVGYHSEQAVLSEDEFTAPATHCEIALELGHQGTYTQIQARTCTQDGKWRYSSNCTRPGCGALINGQTITLKAIGHVPVSGEYPTCTNGVECVNCSELAIQPLGHDFVVPGCVLTESAANGFYCQRCGYLPTEKGARATTLAAVLNLIKSPAYATKRVSSFSKSKMNTSYSKFDFGIYTSVVKDYYEKEVAATTVDYDPLETASIFELFPLRNRAYAVKPTFSEDDVKSIKIEQLNGMNTNSFLSGYDEQDPTKGADTVMPNISSFKNKTINEKVIKVTLALKNETYQKNGSNIPTGSTINSYGQKVYTEDTHASKIFDYDIRRIVDNAGFDAGTWQITEGGDDEGYEMTMTLNYIKADTTLTYYFTADDYQPIAAVCHISENMDQDLTMKIMSIDGVIKPLINTERSYVYLFSDFFNGLS